MSAREAGRANDPSRAAFGPAGSPDVPSRRFVPPYRLLLIVFALAIHVCVWQSVNADPVGDELRYLDQAKRILGNAPVYEQDVVKNPPLYPLFLAALLKIGVSVSNLKLASVLATTAAASVLFSLLGRVCALPWAFALACLFLLYPPLLMLGSQLMTEPFAVLLLLLACRLLLGIRDFRRPGLPRLLALALALAALALLKPLFGYAAAAASCIALVLCAARAWNLRRFTGWIGAATLLSIILCTPYLAYVHSLTGGYFDWGNTGSEHLYWMSIGGEDVWGSWVPLDKVGDIDFLVRNGHAAEVIVGEAMQGPDAQAYYLQLGLQRVRENPEHLVINLFANAARVLFNYPYSFRSQSLLTYAYLLPNMVLYLSLALSFALLAVNHRRQHPGLASAIAFCMIYLGGNILVGSTGRQGVVLVGPILLWLAFQARLLIDAGILVLPRTASEGSDRVPSEDVRG